MSAPAPSISARALLAALGAGLAVWFLAESLARAQIRQSDARVNAAFSATAAGWQEAIQREADLFIEVLESLRHLHALADNIDADAFAEFEAKGLAFTRAELGSFGFAQRIRRGERAAFESAAGSAPARRILEPGPEWLQPAAERDYWFPVVHTDPSDLAPLGFDLAAEPQQRERIERAGRTGATTVGAPFLSTDPLILSPIIGLRFEPAGNAYASEWRGFVFAWLPPQRLLERALPARAAAFARAELTPAAGLSALGDAAGEPRYEGPIRIADQTWTFRARAEPGYRAAQRADSPRLLRAAGAASALLAALLAGLLAGNHVRVRRLVEERTADLQREREERLRLEHELLEAGRRERQRVGQDLHDSLGQKLSGAALLARAAAQGTPPAARGQVEKVAELIKDSVAQVRRIARGLAPVDLDNASLDAALQRLAAEVCDLQGVACAVEAAPGVHARDAATALHLYQMAQEAVSNAIRHGGATDLRISLRRDGARGVLEIRDNGSGLPADAAARGGLGLRLMRYRADLIGAELSIAPSTPPPGTTVSCRFAVQPGADP
jgi:signal transduction histidine kinase